MRKILPILLAATVYLTPLYPIYAFNGEGAPPPRLKNASSEGKLNSEKYLKEMERKLMKDGRKLEKIEDKMASREAYLKEKLAKFKDKVKARRVETINSNLNIVNTNRTQEMEKALERISKVLEKLKSKAAEAAAAGKDATEINAQIKKVEEAWTSADIALKAQIGKDYTIAVNTESTVKTDASAARDALKTDLKTVHEQVMAVRQSLGDAIKAAYSLFGGNNNGSN